MMDNESMKKFYNVLKNESEKRDGKLESDEKHDGESEDLLDFNVKRR